MAIHFEVEDVKFPPIKKRISSSWIKTVIDSYGFIAGDIAYIFCGDEKILEVNKEYLQHDYYTDIITFDYTEDLKVSGDLFISLDTVKTNAEKFGTIYEEELRRVMIHGILHLCGFGDRGDEEQKTMREKEDQALNIFQELLLK
ncbi:endoribonuclease YbeY [Bacteroidales bacterium]|nr:endoribonuclease YbeY [Bacteroidales bacterium]